jgi:hypothetical protein
MEWFEHINIEPWKNKLNYEKQVIALGSCFTEHIGQRLVDRKFNAFVNPFGITFNPMSIFRQLQRSLEERSFKKSELIEHLGQFHHFDAHGSYSATDFKELLTILNDQLIRSHETLKTANFIFLTFGTAWVYEHNGTVVANCHKLNQSEFQRKLLSAEEIIDIGNDVMLALRKVNPNIYPVFTVSPVKYKREGFSENHISKGRLIDAAIHLAYTSGGVYFPSYEMLADGLRDYRFYAKNRTHPSEEATDYIWNRFKDVAVEENAIITMNEIERVQRSVEHRPLHPGSEEHWTFVQKMLREIDQLENKLELDFSKEKTHLLQTTKTE